MAQYDINLKEATVLRTECANLIGEHSTESAAEARKRKLADLACAPYTVSGGDGKERLLAGAFVTREAAEEFRLELRTNGVEAQVVKR